MKAFLFCTSFVDASNIDHHPARYAKWLNYYVRLADELQVDNIFIIDDGGSQVKELKNNDTNVIFVEDGLPEALLTRVNVISFEQSLGRDSTMDYPGWWRSYTFAKVIADTYGFHKMIHVESDFFILSKKMLTFMREKNKGWVSFFSNFYNFSETAIQIICNDQFSKFDEILKRSIASKFIHNEYAELIIPFTEINCDFKGDRFGELPVMKHWMDLQETENEFDYIGQLPSQIKVLNSKDMFSLFQYFRKSDGLSEQSLLNYLLKTNSII